MRRRFPSDFAGGGRGRTEWTRITLDTTFENPPFALPSGEARVEAVPAREVAAMGAALPLPGNTDDDRTAAADNDADAEPAAALNRGTVLLGVIRGVSLRLHFSVLVALPFFAWLAEARMRGPVSLASVGGGQPLAGSWLWAAFLTVGLIVAVLLHESAHAVAGRLAGGRVGPVTLLLLGGCTHVDGLESRGRIAAVAASGPLVSLLSGGALYLAGSQLSIAQVDIRYALLFFAQVQLALGAIDLLPAPPLDGGRLLVTLLEPRLGRARATFHAARLGKLLGAMVAIGGTLTANVLLIALAAVIWAGAEKTQRGTARAEVLRGLTVRSALGPGPWAAPWIDGGATLTALSLRMRRERALRFVVTEGGVLAGVVSAADVARVPPEIRTLTLVREVSREAPAVDVEGSALHAGALMRALRVKLLPVTDGGSLVAMLTDGALGTAEELCALDD